MQLIIFHNIKFINLMKMFHTLWIFILHPRTLRSIVAVVAERCHTQQCVVIDGSVSCWPYVTSLDHLFTFLSVSFSTSLNKDISMSFLSGRKILQRIKGLLLSVGRKTWFLLFAYVVCLPLIFWRCVTF